MRAALWLVLAGCFKPTYHDGLACASDGWCPPPQKCGGDGFCHLVAPTDGGGGSDASDAPSSPPPNYAFVTSQQYPLSMFANRAALDAKCNDLATAAHKPGTYVAWFSISGSNAMDRLAGVPGWVRADGETFASNVQEMVAGKMYAPLRIDETGVDRGEDVVATATDATGTYTFGEACFGTGGTGGIDFGFAHAGKNWWTHTGNNSQVGCMSPVRYYCFEVDSGTAAPLPAHTGKLAFLSTVTIDGGEMLSGMDVRCQSDGPSGGTYVALVGSGVSPNAFPASDRITPNLVRPDGVLFTDSTNTIIAPLDVTVGKNYLDAPVWTGTAISYNAPANQNDDCNGWSDKSTVFMGRTGSSAQTSDATFGNGGTMQCNGSLRIYCIEQ